MATALPRTIIITSIPSESGCLSVPVNFTSSTVNFSSGDSLLDPPAEGEGGPRKRRRLTHLSPDERMMRRKLKNREAAQTARDRKKARMDSLEDKLSMLEAENMRLQRENELLRHQSGNLSKENTVLKNMLEQEDETDERSVLIENELGPESAVLCTPPQKEQVRAQFLLMTQVVACLLTASPTYWDSCSSSQTQQQQQAMPQSRPLDLRVQSSKQQTSHEKWWGPQQQSWNPSAN